MAAVLTLEEQKIIEELESALKGFFGGRLKRYVLFGSRARGDYGPESDIDLAIVVKGLSHREKTDILDVVADLEMKYLIPLSTLVISEDNFELLKKRERRLALDIETEGIAL